MNVGSFIKDNLIEYFRLTSNEHLISGHSELFISDIKTMPFYNAIFLISYNITNKDLPKEIATICMLFKQKRDNFCWFVNSDFPFSNELGDALIKAGFVKVTGEFNGFEGLALDLTKFHRLATLPNSYSFNKVENKEQFEEFIKPVTIGFGLNQADSKALCEKFKQLSSNDNLKHFVAYHNNMVVGFGSVFLQNKVAGLYNMSVLPEHRNHGIGAYLQQIRLDYAKEKGCNIAVIQAAGTSSRISKRLGFQSYNNFIPYIYTKEI